jgi:hypothetical protein
MKSFAVPAGMTAEQVLEALGQQPAAAVKTTTEPQAQAKRARQRSGQFKGDDPATPDANEAWTPES